MITIELMLDSHLAAKDSKCNNFSSTGLLMLFVYAYMAMHKHKIISCKSRVLEHDLIMVRHYHTEKMGES